MRGYRIVPLLVVATFLSGCGGTIHHLGPESPDDLWQEMNELTESAESRLTLVNGQQLLVRDVELHPETSSFVEPHQNERLLIRTDQIVGLLVFNRGTNAYTSAVKSGLVVGGAFALLGYLSGDEQEGFFRPQAEDKALAGFLIGGTVGTMIGYASGYRDSIALQFEDAVVPVAPHGSHPGEPSPILEGVAEEEIEFLPEEPTPSGSGRKTHWRVTSTFGYTSALVALGYGAWELGDQYDPRTLLSMAALGGTVGFVIGYSIGSSADDKLSYGRTLSSRHRFAVRLGTVLSGTGVGLLAAVSHINSSEDNTTGGKSDEDVAMDYALWGAGLGVFAQGLMDSGLYPEQDDHTSLSIVPNGRYLALRYTFD